MTGELERNTRMYWDLMLRQQPTTVLQAINGCNDILARAGPHRRLRKSTAALLDRIIEGGRRKKRKSASPTSNVVAFLPQPKEEEEKEANACRYQKLEVMCQDYARPHKKE